MSDKPEPIWKAPPPLSRGDPLADLLTHETEAVAKLAETGPLIRHAHVVAICLDDRGSGFVVRHVSQGMNNSAHVASLAMGLQREADMVRQCARLAIGTMPPLLDATRTAAVRALFDTLRATGAYPGEAGRRMLLRMLAHATGLNLTAMNAIVRGDPA